VTPSRSRHERSLEWIAVSLPRLILGVLCFTGIAINFANVVGRYVFSAPIIWAEEILVYIMIWCVFIGAILVTWEGRHIKMDLLAVSMPVPWRYIVNGLMVLTFILICLFVMKQSWTLTAMMAEVDQQSVVARLPMAAVHASILVGFTLMLLAVLVRLKAYVTGDMGSEAEATAEQLRELYGEFDDNDPEAADAKASKTGAGR
jgi:TRAP-type C4-dicarboxylate transport system permease small subunit